MTVNFLHLLLSENVYTLEKYYYGIAKIGIINVSITKHRNPSIKYHIEGQAKLAGCNLYNVNKNYNKLIRQ